MSGECLIIRADASVQIGTGHVMRCLALAQAWQDAGDRVTFAMRESTPALDARLRAEQCEVVGLGGDVGTLEDSENTAALAQERGAQWVVVDGYRFSADYQRALKQRGFRLVCLDDNGDAGHYFADFVLNQNLHAAAELYRDRDANTHLLLGTRFALLRREFRSWKGWTRKVSDDAHRILITMGGSDPDNVTALVLEAVMSYPELQADVVLGGSNPHLGSLREVAMRFDDRVTLHENVTDMTRLMAAADVAVSGAGTTTLEMCFLGLPGLILVLADNQRDPAKALGDYGAALNLGNYANLSLQLIAEHLTILLASPAARKSMAESGHRLVDGCGAERLAILMGKNSLKIRTAQPDDALMFWNWANEPSVREAAFSSAAIPWEEHCRWFEGKLRDARCRMFVGLDEWNTPIGQIRFDETNGMEVEVDVSVDKRFRGLGLARHLINIGCRTLVETRPVKHIHAFIKPANIASAKAFGSVGFRCLGMRDIGPSAIHYTLDIKESE